MSKDSNKIKKGLKALQELKSSANTDLTQDEQQVLNQIITLAEEKKLIEPLEEKSDEEINFSLDLGIKEIFTDISDSLILEMINYMQDTNFLTTREINLNFTEYFKVKDDNRKLFVRGDISALIHNGKKDEITDLVLIEFQATNTANVPSRMHAYGNNNLKLIKHEVNAIKDGKPIKKKEKVYVRPIELIIYTSTKFKKKEGVIRFNTTTQHYQTNGIDQYGANGDVVTHLIPFVNLFQMSLKELNDSKFSFLQCIYLYKYKQDKSLIKNAKITKIAKQIEQNLRNSLSPEDFEIVNKHLQNIYKDIYNIIKSTPDLNDEELKNMEALLDNFYDRTKAEGISIGRAERKEEDVIEGKSEIVKNMIKENMQDEIIAKLSGFPLSQIEKIRKEQSQ